MTLRLATRGSPLARLQTKLVADRLVAAGDPEPAVVVVETEGDRRRDVPIAELERYGAFTNEVDRAVLEGRADVAVHSAKDLPAATDPGVLLLAAVPERADPRDALVGRPLEEIVPGGLVLSGAPRRRAQLASVRPDLTFAELRGNIGTRLQKVPDGGAVVVALAALARLGLDLDEVEVLPMSVMLPQVGQGALALRCRPDDEGAIASLRAIDDPSLHLALRAERAFLVALGAGCRAPVGAYATIDGAPGEIAIEAMVACEDGRVLLRRRAAGEDPESLGAEVARALMVDDAGAALIPGLGDGLAFGREP